MLDKQAKIDENSNDEKMPFISMTSHTVIYMTAL